MISSHNNKHIEKCVNKKGANVRNEIPEFKFR